MSRGIMSYAKSGGTMSGGDNVRFPENRQPILIGKWAGAHREISRFSGFPAGQSAHGCLYYKEYMREVVKTSGLPPGR